MLDDLALLALGYHLASRLAYVVGVGMALQMQKREQVFTRRAGVEAGYRRFRRMANWLMNNDAVSFLLLCLVTRHTFELGLPAWLPAGVGVLLTAGGFAVKYWAAKRLGMAAYYWWDFFAPGEGGIPDPPGPYRYLKNPMYTVGYLPAYGVALFFGSLPGLIAALFDQTAILVFHARVEKPHIDALIDRSYRREAAD